jgi:hypothetical protein
LNGTLSRNKKIPHQVTFQSIRRQREKRVAVVSQAAQQKKPQKSKTGMKERIQA